MNFGVSTDTKKMIESAMGKVHEEEEFKLALNEIPFHELLIVYKYLVYANKKLSHIMYKETQHEMHTDLLEDFIDKGNKARIVEPRNAKELAKFDKGDPHKVVINIKKAQTRKFKPDGKYEFDYQDEEFPSLGGPEPLSQMPKKAKTKVEEKPQYYDRELERIFALTDKSKKKTEVPVAFGAPVMTKSSVSTSLPKKKQKAVKKVIEEKVEDEDDALMAAFREEFKAQNEMKPKKADLEAVKVVNKGGPPIMSSDDPPLPSDDFPMLLEAAPTKKEEAK